MAFVLLTLLVCGVIAAMVAENKGNSGLGGLFAGFFLGPLGILYEAVHPVSAKRLERKRERDGLKKCPQCAEWVKREASVCRHCGYSRPPHGGTAGAG